LLARSATHARAAASILKAPQSRRDILCQVPQKQGRSQEI
jgi:hypothetical protein